MTRGAKAVCVPCVVPGAQSTCSSPTFVSLPHPGTRYRPGPATSMSQGACARRTLIAQRVSEPRRRGPEACCYYWESGVKSCVLIPSRQLRKTLSILPLHPEPDNAGAAQDDPNNSRLLPLLFFRPQFPSGITQTWSFPIYQRSRPQLLLNPGLALLMVARELVRTRI